MPALPGLAKGAPAASRFPVSKTRLETLGSGVGGPRPRSAAPTAYPMKPTVGADLGKPGEPGGKLEQEYIYNLQQQVYLQELELKPELKPERELPFGFSPPCCGGFLRSRTRVMRFVHRRVLSEVAVALPCLFGRNFAIDDEHGRWRACPHRVSVEGCRHQRLRLRACVDAT